MSTPTTVNAYLAALPEDRRKAVSAVRAVIRKNLPKGYEEGIQYGMIGYFVPHAIYPAGYHANPKEPLPFAHLASQKSHMALYLMGVYGDAKLAAWFTGAWKKAGRKLDMGKACVRFKELADLPLDVVGEVIAKVPVEAFVKRYEASIPVSSRAKTAAKKTAAKKTAAKKTAAKKTAAKATRKPAARAAKTKTAR
jgi:hypothetical protein